MTHSHLKTVPIANEMVFLSAVVVPKHLLVQIAEQVERFNVDVCSLESALEKAPEILQSVCVNLPVNVGLSMVYDLVLESLVPESLIGHERIGIDRAPRLNVSANLGLQVMLPASGNDIGADLAPTFQNAHDSSFTLDAPVSNFLAALVGVHESGCATDESLVYFYFFAAPAEPYSFLLMQSETDAVHHKPSGLLRNAESAGNFIGTDSILGIHNQPNGNHPFVHAERGILKDGSHLDSELLFASLAEPKSARRDKRVLSRIAAWARYLAIWPAQLYRVVERALRVREESNCFLQRLGKLESVCHV